MATRLREIRIEKAREYLPGLEVLLNKEFWKTYLPVVGASGLAFLTSEKLLSEPVSTFTEGFTVGAVLMGAASMPKIHPAARAALFAAAITDFGILAYKIYKKRKKITTSLKKMAKEVREGKVKEVLLYFTPHKEKELEEETHTFVETPAEEYIPVETVEEQPQQTETVVEEVTEVQEQQPETVTETRTEEKRQEESTSGLLV